MAVTNRKSLVLNGVNVGNDVVTGLKRVGFYAASLRMPAMGPSHSRHVLASQSSAIDAERAVLSGWPMTGGEPRPTAACCLLPLPAGAEATVDQAISERFQAFAVPASYRSRQKTRPDIRGGNDRTGHAAWFRSHEGTLPASTRG
jgi:hypothetical protein